MLITAIIRAALIEAKTTVTSITKSLLVIALSFFGSHIIIQIGIFYFDLNKNWLEILNMDREFNLPTLFAVFLFIASSLLLKKISFLKGKESSSDWILLSKIFLFLAFDEALQIHEIFIFPDLRPYIHPSLGSTWVIPYGVLLVVIAWRFQNFLKRLPRITCLKLLQSGFVYVLGAIGMEMLGSFAVRSELIRLHSFAYGAITGVEELLEFLGLILLINTLGHELIKRDGEQTFIFGLKN